MLLTALMAMLAVVACNSNKPKGQLKRGAMLYINVSSNQLKAMEETTNTPTTEERLYTPAEIVKDCSNFCIDDPEGSNDVLVGIGEEMRDYEHNRIKMWGEQIITEKGELVEYFMRSRNVRVIGRGTIDDVIAYIPNKTMREGWNKIKKAYDAGNYEEVYRLFQEVYTAIPITPSEYAKLKEKGEN